MARWQRQRAADKKISLHPSIVQELRLRCKKGMKKHHWCPHQINYLAKIFDLDTFTYLSQLMPLGQRRNHRDCEQHLSCVAYNVDMSIYVTQHTHPGCKCGMIGVPYEQLTNIIKSGGVPILSVDEGDLTALETGERLKLQIRTRSSSDHYIAISHVWADGLGNPSQNALPFCQVRRLAQQLEVISSTQKWVAGFRKPHFYIWMDTLCIPVKEEDEDLKMQAIHSMASIYTKADAIYVLDAGLMSFSPKQIDEEVFAQILCCTWNTRSWTLHEAALARRWVLQLFDQVIIFDRHNLFQFTLVTGTHQRTVHKKKLCVMGESLLMYGLKRSSLPSYLFALAMPKDPKQMSGSQWIMKRVQSELFAIMDCNPVHEYATSLHSSLDAHQFIMVWNALAGRSTTKPDDLYHIFANILGIKTEALSRMRDVEERFHSMFLRFKSLPSSLLFENSSRPSEHGSPMNEFLPSGIGPRILRHGPTLQVGREICLKLQERNPDHEVEILGCIVPQSFVCLHACVLSIRDTEYNCALEGLAHHDQGEFSNSSICVLVELPLEPSRNEVQGTCFYIVGEAKPTGYGTIEDDFELIVVFCCRLRLKSLTKDNNSQVNLAAPKFTAVLIPCGSLIKISYEQSSSKVLLYDEGNLLFSIIVTISILMGVCYLIWYYDSNQVSIAMIIFGAITVLFQILAVIYWQHIYYQRFG